jgi:hypothetical protein
VRYLNLVLVLVVAGSGSTFGCGGNSASISASQGGASGEAAGGVSGAGATAGKAGTAGKGGAGAAGSGGSAGGSVGGEGGVGPSGGDAGALGQAGEGGAAGATTQETPTLTVTVSGLPVGQTPNVTITGPASFSQSLSATTTLSDLAAGSYAVAAPASIRVSGTEVDSIYDATITGSPADVEAGATANVTVTYTQRPGTGMLWVTNWVTHNAFGFSADQLATGTPTSNPTVSLGLPDLGNSSPATVSLAFSSTNDAWIGTCKTTQKPQVVGKFSPAKLAASGSPAADVEITLPSTDATYDCASALVFDTSGNLWVGMYRGDILKFSASDLTATGTPTPAVTLTNTTYFDGLVDLAFDTAGDLLVGAYYHPAVSVLSPAQLSASATAIIPSVSISLPAGAGIGGLTIGADGSVWVADYTHSSVMKFNASDFAATGAPTPSVTLTGLGGPEQMAFDNAGNLWVAAFDTSKVYGIAAADLATSGAPTPIATFTGGGSLSETYGVRFSPAAQ